MYLTYHLLLQYFTKSVAKFNGNNLQWGFSDGTTVCAALPFSLSICNLQYPLGIFAGDFKAWIYM